MARNFYTYDTRTIDSIAPACLNGWHTQAPEVQLACMSTECGCVCHVRAGQR